MGKQARRSRTARADELERAGGPIRFGTSGWRGVLADEVTLPRVRALTAAVGRWLAREHPRARVLVAHDRRFLGACIANTAVRVLAGAGLRAVPVRGAVPTPVVAHALRRGRADAALVVTASHNPPEYQGVKLLVGSGVGAGVAQTREVEKLACEALAGRNPPEAEPTARPLDLVRPYLDAVGRVLEPRALRRTRMPVFYDAMHGTGAGILDAALAEAGARVELLRGAPDPTFGGAAPDPAAERLGALVRAVRAAPAPALGLATDGDADRYAVIDADGRRLTATEALALLVDHLASTGRARRGVAISVATGSLVERVALARGLAVTRHPIGFKHLSATLERGEADVAGEESGGFALGKFVRDKDGILAGCLLAELAATIGLPLRSRLRELARRHGRCDCGRLSLPLDGARVERLARLYERPPARVDGTRVLDVQDADGLRLELPDGFLFLRASGTEPVVRVYAEAPGAAGLRRRLRAGVRLLGAGQG